MRNEITRREFLAATAAGAAGLALTGTGVLAAERVLGANDRLRVGLIGVGDRMGSLMNEFHGLKDSLNCELVAVCDIWKPNREKAVKKVTDWYGAEPKVYDRYEDMLAAKDIDGLIIATADFHHATMLRNAILAGKHTYCEKPTANTLDDANALIQVAEAHPNVIVQVGTQRRSEGNYYAAADFLKSGALGTVSRVNISWNYYGARWIRNLDGVKAEDVDWKQFQMGRDNRAFTPQLFREWRLFRPFSTGIPCQWLSHMIDAAHMVTGARYPKSCVAMGGTYVWNDERQNGDTFEALYRVPGGVHPQLLHRLRQRFSRLRFQGLRHKGYARLLGLEGHRQRRRQGRETQGRGRHQGREDERPHAKLGRVRPIRQAAQRPRAGRLSARNRARNGRPRDGYGPQTGIRSGEADDQRGLAPRHCSISKSWRRR